MPTGYTNTLIEKGQTFPQFALTCARAFGAFAEMRDDPLDAPIPDSFKPSDYHAKALKKARATLKRLERMTDKEKAVYGAAQRKRTMAYHHRHIKRYHKQNAVLDAMAKQVSEWTPPTSDHENIKAFMLQQIEISKGGDYYENALNQVVKTTPLQNWTTDVEDAKRAVEYCAEEIETEKACAERNTRWVQELKKSLVSQ